MFRKFRVRFEVKVLPSHYAFGPRAEILRAFGCSKGAITISPPFATETQAMAFPL